MVKNGSLRFLLLELILAYQLADILPWYRYPVVKNGDLRFLLLELILADQLTDLHPPVEAPSGQERQFEISTVRAHIGRSTPTPSRGI